LSFAKTMWNLIFIGDIYCQNLRKYSKRLAGDCIAQIFFINDVIYNSKNEKLLNLQKSAKSMTIFIYYSDDEWTII
jgi:hypothetical protein